MFSGKSTELLRRLRMAQIARKRTAAFKHASDVRFADDQIATHTDERSWAMAVSTAHEIRESWHARGAHVIGIDEAQFFGEELIDVAEQLIAQGKRVVLAGLNQDSYGRPFGSMPELMARADSLFLAHAVCIQCGRDATPHVPQARNGEGADPHWRRGTVRSPLPRLLAGRRGGKAPTGGE